MQISERVHALKIPFQVRLPSGIAIDRFVYVYLIYGSKIYLIDTGVASSELLIFDYIMKTGRNPGEISTLILTHSHPDHIGAAQAIKKATGCAIAAHPAEKDWIEDVQLQERERPVPSFHSLVGGSVRVDRALEDKDILELGDAIKLEVFHTPGHSKGSVSLFMPEERVLFSGDAIPLKGDIPIYEDVLSSVESIRKLKGIEDIQLLLASWDDPKSGDVAYQRMDEGIKYLDEIHQIVCKLSGEGISDPMELCQRVLSELGIPQAAANPLVARSFAANLKIGSNHDLMNP